jgi:endoglucanase
MRNLSAQIRRLTHTLTGLLLVFSSGVMNTPSKQILASPNYLHTSGSQILDASNKVVGLSGVNWFGFETSNYAPHGLWARNWQDILDQVKREGYNVIRLPFSNAMLKENVVPSGIDYQKNPDLNGLTSLQVMDSIIRGANQRGIKIILDNHRSTPGGGPESNGLWYTNGHSEADWIHDWKKLAYRYKYIPAVIAVDLRNEPYNACWGCGDSSKDWRLAAERAGNAVLSVNPNLLIIVEGVAVHNGQYTWWGGNLMGAKEQPVRLNLPHRLVYSAHEYPESIYPQPWFSDPNYPRNLPAVWDKYWGYLVRENIAPVLIGEFGTRYETEKDKRWLMEFQKYIQDNDLSWTFWSLNPNSGDTGGLLRDDWINVHPEKQNILEKIQYPFIVPYAVF